MAYMRSKKCEIIAKKDESRKMECVVVKFLFYVKQYKRAYEGRV